MKLKNKLMLLLASVALVLPLASTNIASVHASMPDPNLYYTNGHHDSVYYSVTKDASTPSYGSKIYYIHSQMPNSLRKAKVYGLYKGLHFDKNTEKFLRSGGLAPIYRNGHRYDVDYVGYNSPKNKVKIGKHTMYIEAVDINDRDVGKRAHYNTKNYVKSIIKPKNIVYKPVNKKYHSHSHKRMTSSKRRAIRKQISRLRSQISHLESELR